MEQVTLKQHWAASPGLLEVMTTGERGIISFLYCKLFLRAAWNSKAMLSPTTTQEGLHLLQKVV